MQENVPSAWRSCNRETPSLACPASASTIKGWSLVCFPFHLIVQWSQLWCGLSDTDKCQEVFVRDYKLPSATSLPAFPSQWGLVKIRQTNAGCPGRDVLIDLTDYSLTLIFGCTEQTSPLFSSPPESVPVLRSVRETVKQKSELWKIPTWFDCWSLSELQRRDVFCIVVCGSCPSSWTGEMRTAHKLGYNRKRKQQCQFKLMQNWGSGLKKNSHADSEGRVGRVLESRCHIMSQRA